MPGDRDRGNWRPADTVPRKMLDLCTNTLRQSLARNIELLEQIEQLEHEVERLEQMLRRHRG
jgi:hypothetical protein